MPSMNGFCAARRSSLLWLLTTAGTLALGAPVTDARKRPAILVRQPERAVLLAGACAGRRLVVAGERGIIALSEDQGRSWRQAAVGVSVTLTAIRFVDALNGMAVGHGGTVLTTSDGGEHWLQRLDGNRVAEIMLQTATASGDLRALKEAHRLVQEGADKPFLDLVVTDEKNAMAVGAYGLAMVTRDRGANWVSWTNRLDNPKSLHIYCARRIGDSILLAGEQGLLLLSRDDGYSFQRLTSPYAGSFFTAELLPEGGLIAAGLRGNVWRADVRGGAWAQVRTPVPVSITSSVLRADGSLVLGSQAGDVLELRGDELIRINAKPLPPINGLLQCGGPTMLALTVQGAVVAEILPRAFR
jgi:photosystem II stability/assembly factor-like uncharacterized protein